MKTSEAIGHNNDHKHQISDIEYSCAGKRFKASEHYKQPTNEELSTLREVESLFHSNVFRFQVEELVNEVAVKDKYKMSIADFITSLTSFLLQLPDEDYLQASRSYRMSKVDGISVPLQQNFVQKQVFRGLPFTKPTAVKVIGGYPLGLLTYPNATIDLAVEMPKCWFDKADSINQMYHQKRAFYLTCLAAKLNDSIFSKELKFSYFHGDLYKPTLLMIPKGKLSKRVMFLFLPHFPHGFMKMQQFMPRQSNISSSWFFQNKDDILSFHDLPTPKYNSSVLMDSTYEANLLYLNTIIGDLQSIREGIILLKIWLHQRDLDKGLGGFSSFIMSMYAAYLFQMKKLSQQTSSFQLVRNVWLHLKQSNWTTDGITLNQRNNEKWMPSLVDFHAAFEVVFIDPSGYVNLCANMSSITFLRVKHEAQLALEVLEACNVNYFETLFMMSVPFIRKFDHVICFDSPQCFKHTVKKLNLHHMLVDNNDDYMVVALPKIIQLLHTGLGKRIKLIDFHLEPSIKVWPISKGPPSNRETYKLFIGFLLDENFFSCILDKGPLAASIEAVQFRDFWGDLSELRRFQDSSICETVIWRTNSLAERHMVCEQVVRHVLQRHAHIHDQDFHYMGGTLTSLLFPKQEITAVNCVSSEKQAKFVFEAHNVLVKTLCNLEGLILPISSIQGISPVFRHTEVFTQLPVWRNKLLIERNKIQLLDIKKIIVPSLLKPILVILHLEGSGKWPNDVNAIRSLKAAFHIKLSELLNNKACLPCTVQPDHLDVFCHGYLFRLMVTCSNELTALKTVHNKTGIIATQETRESRNQENISIAMPKITASLHGLQSHYGSYSSACRLSKRWLAAQLLTDHIPEICIDLIVAYLFLLPYPYTSSVCGQVVFLRFLEFLASYDWNSFPLIINLNNELKRESIVTIQNMFTKQRCELPAMFIATPYETCDSNWTKNNPTLQALHRITVLADESIKLLERTLVMQNLKSQCKIAFRPPLDLYDVLIYLDVKIIPMDSLNMAVDAQSSKALQHEAFHDTRLAEFVLPVVDFNPVIIFLNKLRETFNKIAKFFYDPYGGSFIAVLWKPQAFVPKQFKIGNVNAMMISSVTKAMDAVNLVPNVIAIVEDFKLMGQNIVLSVESRSEKWNFA